MGVKGGVNELAGERPFGNTGRCDVPVVRTKKRGEIFCRLWVFLLVSNESKYCG